jgi:hypothetical protein
LLGAPASDGVEGAGGAGVDEDAGAASGATVAVPTAAGGAPAGR